MKENRDSDKELYNSKMCIYCTHRDDCNKNLFNVFVFRDKVTMNCPRYEFDRPEFDNSEEVY